MALHGPVLSVGVDVDRRHVGAAAALGERGRLVAPGTLDGVVSLEGLTGPDDLAAADR